MLRSMSRMRPPLLADRHGWPRSVLMTADAVGGVWSYAMDLVRGFADREIEVLLAVMGDPPNTQQLAAAAAIPGLRLEIGPFRLEWMPGADSDVGPAGRWLRALEQDFAPDLVHLNGYAHADLEWRAPVVVIAHSCVRTWWRAVHGEDPPPAWDGYANRVRRGLTAADLVIAPTAAFLAAITAAYGILAAARVVTNGRACATSAANAVGAKDPVILCAARLWDEAKNVRTLDAAAAELAWPVHVAGSAEPPDGADAEAFRHIRPLGVLAAGDLRSRLDRAAIFVSPALYEPFGLAVLEAAQSGCALVLSDIPTFRELWHDAAVFVPPRDPQALARALSALSCDPERIEAYGIRAARRAQAYDAKAMTRGTLEAYIVAASRFGARRLGRRHRPVGAFVAPLEVTP